MSDVTPIGLDRRRVQQLLKEAKTAARTSSRIDRISAALVGLPYVSNPLIGSAEQPEQLTVAMQGFDCVTYVETVVALAQSHDTPGFIDNIRRIRYEDGRVDWKRRNHYMTQWIRNNVRAGAVKRIPAVKSDVFKQRILDMLPGLAPKNMKFNCVKKSELKRYAGKLETGDLVFFGSTRKHLDIFHCGVVIKKDDAIIMRHASRSRGEVVEQPLDDFLKKNRMSCIFLVRPAEAA